MKFRLGVIAVIAWSLAFSTSTAYGQTAFTPGNVVIYRVGDGTQTLVNTGNSVFLDEYTPTGTFVRSINVTSLASGQAFLASGTATSEGQLTQSADGTRLLLPGYAQALPNTTALPGSASATVNRSVVQFDSSGTLVNESRFSDWATGNNPRSVASPNGTDLYLTGGSGGARYATAQPTTAAATSVQLSTTVANLRNANVTAGQLYVSSASGSTRVATVGTGLPTTSGQTITNLPGFPTTGSPYSFAFADLSPAVAGVDTLYVADDAAGIQKYSLVAGNWTLNNTAGTATDAFRGLTAVQNGASVTLFATSSTKLSTLIDTAGYNANFSSTSLTDLATAGVNTAFRGVAFSPVPVPEPGTVLALAAGILGVGRYTRRRLRRAVAV